MEEEELTRLPGYREEAVVRHFDAPEAVDTRFYEVRAKSILNHVPEQSYVPFRWTINPYRGCSHACTYCMSGDTRVLGADGREIEIRDIEVGARIIGTHREGVYRRFVETEVLDKWSSIKPAFLVELEDGTELITSGDHRFLSGRGWKYVTGQDQGRWRRPHLTERAQLLGTGGSVAAPVHDRDYRRGYLCAIVRGDGNLARYADGRPDRPNSFLYRFRLALADEEALARARRFLEREEVATSEFAFSAASAGRRAIRAIRSQTKSSFDRVSEIVEWPANPSSAWTRGFLAGIFDAEGSCSRGVLRISNTDEEIVRWIVWCFERLGFDVVVERRPGKASTVRLRGGLPARMRFMLGTDPAITRKRSITGCAVKNPEPLRVRSIRALGMAQRMYDITTGTGDFIANGVVSHNCFARPTHKYLDFDAGRDFEREIVVKVNAPELLRVELARPKWTGEHVALGTNTDPYQWVEGRYKLMQGIWEAMRDAANPCSILTKSPLLLRDLALMRQINERTEFSAALSIPTLEEKAWRATEPRTPNPRARLEAVGELSRAGIRTGVLIAPLMPGVNDQPEQVEEITRLAYEAGASHVTPIALHLRGEVKPLFFEWLAEHRSDLVPRYKQLYRRGAYAPPAERERLSSLVKRSELRPGNGMGGKSRRLRRKPEPAERSESPGRFGQAERSESAGASGPGERSERAGAPEPAPQESLF
jgi:DNA repair photolyase